MDKFELTILIVGVLSITTLLYYSPPNATLFAIVISIFFATLFFAQRSQRKRNERVNEFCIANSWKRLARSDEAYMGSPYLIKQELQLAGTILDKPARIMEGYYRLGKNAPRVITISVEIDVPDFTLTPEGFGSKLAEKFGGQDIDFVDDKKFSDWYRLQGPDENKIRRFFTPSVRQYMLSEVSATTMYARDGWLHFCFTRRFDPSYAKEKIETVMQFIRHTKLVDSTGQP